MKITKTKQTRIFKGQTLTTQRTVQIHHHQSVKLSKNYNSSEVSYGVELTVLNTNEAIRKGQKRAERLVEGPLVVKVKEQSQVLDSLA